GFRKSPEPCKSCRRIRRPRSETSSWRSWTRPPPSRPICARTGTERSADHERRDRKTPGTARQCLDRSWLAPAAVAVAHPLGADGKGPGRTQWLGPPIPVDERDWTHPDVRWGLVLPDHAALSD